MQPAVRIEQTKCNPALVDPRGRLSLKPTNVACPEGERSQSKTEPSSYRFCKSCRRGLAITTPLEWESLRASACSSSKQNSIVLAEPLLYCFVNQLVVEEGVVIVHATWVHALVMPLYVLGGNALTKVGLDRIDAHVEQLIHASTEPFARFRVSEVHHAHARLPQIPLPYIAVGFFKEVALFGSIFEDRAGLSNIRIGPDVDFVEQARLVSTVYLSFRVWEVLWIPNIVGLMESAEQKTIEMEDFYWDLRLRHPRDEVVDGVLIVRGSEGCT